MRKNVLCIKQCIYFTVCPPPKKNAKVIPIQTSGSFRQILKRNNVFILFLRLPCLIFFLSFIDTCVKRMNKIWKEKKNRLLPYKTTGDLYSLYLETREPILSITSNRKNSTKPSLVRSFWTDTSYSNDSVKLGWIYLDTVSPVTKMGFRWHTVWSIWCLFRLLVEKHQSASGKKCYGRIEHGRIQNGSSNFIFLKTDRTVMGNK